MCRLSLGKLRVDVTDGLTKAEELADQDVRRRFEILRKRMVSDAAYIVDRFAYAASR
jgi:hypothetical protein